MAVLQNFNKFFSTFEDFLLMTPIYKPLKNYIIFSMFHVPVQKIFQKQAEPSRRYRLFVLHFPDQMHII